MHQSRLNVNQLNDQWVIGVALGKIRMNGLGMKRIVKGNGRELQLVVELVSCKSDHSHSHTRDGERTSLGLSLHGEAFEVEEVEDKREMMMGDFERRESGLIYGVAKMSKHGADLSWGL